jgi:acyl-CoA reductase-like NAD-dependent aldehyde dehydrogenase
METIKVTSPADGQMIGEVPVSTPQQVTGAVELAANAFHDWKQMPLSERANLLRKLRWLVMTEHERITELVAREEGKPRFEAMIAEITPVMELLTFLIQEGVKLLAPRPVKTKGPYTRDRGGTHYFHPYGPWAVITPWNYPFSFPLFQTASLVFAGNTVLLKPSPLTPLCGQLVGELFERAGFPKGVVQVIQGGAEQAEAMLSDERVRGVLFTGSVQTGRVVMAKAAATNKKMILELGGKDPAIVLSDADLDRTARGVTWGAMMNAGQNCASIERVYVEQSLYEPFLQKLVQEVSQLRVGDPLNPEIDMGPLAAPFQIEKVQAHVQDACERGARLLCGGKVLEHLGPLYYAPTIIAEVHSDMVTMCEETFGPTVAVQPVQDEREAVELANRSMFGLTASVWTQSRERARKIAPQLACGAVTINSHMTSFSEGASSWGGFKDSGIGRTHGEFGLYELVQMQFVNETYSPKPELWWYPYSARMQQISDDMLALLAERSLRGKLRKMNKMNRHMGYLNKFMSPLKTLPGLMRYMK